MKTIAFDAEEKAVRKSAEQLYVALNSMFTGDLAAMKEVWSHAEDVIYMGPGNGFRIGWDQIPADWEAHAATKLGDKVKPENMHIMVGQELGVVLHYEKGEITDAEGKLQQKTIPGIMSSENDFIDHIHFKNFELVGFFCPEQFA